MNLEFLVENAGEISDAEKFKGSSKVRLDVNR